jgi:hypothetical protein
MKAIIIISRFLRTRFRRRPTVKKKKNENENENNGMQQMSGTSNIILHCYRFIRLYATSMF